MIGSRTWRSVDDKSKGFLGFPGNDSSMMKRPRPYAGKAAMAILHERQIFFQ
jgi:hypothetical protein